MQGPSRIAMVSIKLTDFSMRVLEVVTNEPLFLQELFQLASFTEMYKCLDRKSVV